MKIIAEDITYTSGKNTLKAYLAYPAGKKKTSGIIVIHEVFGLNENIKNITSRLAEEGYSAMAVDLFSGENKAVCILRTLKMIATKKSSETGIRFLQSALDYLSEKDFVDAKKIGAVGFCLGGNFAIALSYKDKRIKAIAPFYSYNPSEIRDYSRFCPVVGSYPGKDPTRKEGLKLISELTKSNIPHNIKIYPEAMHSFMNERSLITYDAEASRDAWARTMVFFRKYLR